ncbi:MAG: AAA family ATPase, partial [Bacilli bacterium]|nr:AAA family ATPase [Bacilli bacterium]
FRPVAMSVPDNLQIAQTLLYAEGFKNGDILSKKVTTLFTLCKQGLSYQQHYDWGLRSLKTILTVASQQIQLFINEGKVATYEEETSILIKAIRINVLSKLTFSDSQLFNLLIQDVFPGIDMSDIVYDNLNKALMESYKDLHYEFIDSQFKKVVQFYEACRQRMGVVIVGPSGCGKSAIWKLLEDSFHKLNQKIVVHIINPKAMDRKLLLGYMNHDTGEFTYGVLTKCAREIEKEPSDVKCWIICDGDVDPEWIEALNSVLDDNRLMTMQNGERIHFGNNVNFIFETDSLKFASPATVSRMGIIYMNQEDLDINSIYNSWINKTLPEKGDVIKTWFSNYFEEIYKNYRETFNLQLDTTNYGSINNFLSIFSQIFKDPNINPANISKIGFVDAIIKGLGDNLTIEDRKKFAMDVYKVCGERPSNLSNVLDVYYDSKTQNLISYDYNQIENEISDIKQFSNGYPLIKTTSVQCNLDTLKIWLENNEPFIVVGPEGAGKSLLITYLISQMRSCQMTTLNCTSQTSSTHIIQKLVQNCTMSNTSKGKCLRPRNVAKLILFLKDINLPKPDKYNTIRLIAF